MIGCQTLHDDATVIGCEGVCNDDDGDGPTVIRIDVSIIPSVAFMHTK